MGEEGHADELARLEVDDIAGVLLGLPVLDGRALLARVDLRAGLGLHVQRGARTYILADRWHRLGDARRDARRRREGFGKQRARHQGEREEAGRAARA